MNVNENDWHEGETNSNIIYLVNQGALFALKINGLVSA